jgi:hypothetical protein
MMNMAIVDNEGTVVMFKKKLYRISGMEIKPGAITGAPQIEYRLYPVHDIMGGNLEPLWVRNTSVEFLRN